MMWQVVSHRISVPGGSGRSALYGGGAGAPSGGGGGGGACGGGAAGAGACGGTAAGGASGAAARTAGDCAGACGGGSGGSAARTLFALNVAASSTIPLSAYCVCALKSRPLEHTKSSGTHKSMDLPAYAGPTSTSGWL